MNFKRLVWATTALTGGLVLATQAAAQSTGTQVQESTEVEEVVVTASRGLPTIEGTIVAEQAPKSRSTVTQEYISTQTPGQTVIETVNLIPGVSFTQSDAFGSSGGNLRLRSFDGNRVSLTFDGIPLNDTGNYAIFTNQQLDPELIDRAVVNLGTTDVDSPTASATGGTINYVTRRPSTDMSLMAQGSIGSEDYRRGFLMYDTGELDAGLSAWLAGSWQAYDKFKGPGDLEKWQVNGRLFWDLGDGDFASLAVHYNENRNAFYRNLTMDQIDFYGLDFDNLGTCTRDTTPTPAGRTDDNEAPAGAGSFMTASDNPANPSSCTNFYGLRINPSDTGNIRGQFRKAIGEHLIFTFDPYYQYVLANGGGTTVVDEFDRRLRGAAVAPGVDLNDDGDVLDSVRLYTPNTTNTNRVGLTTSLIWNVNDSHRVRVAYTFDHGDHRQTGAFGFLSPEGHPEHVFGGIAGDGGRPVLTADGDRLQGRNRHSIAELSQWALEYRGLFLDDRLTVVLGLRAPTFTRELDQKCYSQSGSSNVRCTNEPIEGVSPEGYIDFFGSTTQYIAPYKAEFEYKDVLPNVGISYRFTENQVIYASYAEGLSAPRTDNLYTGPRLSATGDLLLTDPDPETTQTYDLGWRYQGSRFIANAAVWYTSYDNRIVSAFDEDLNSFVDRNIGAVELWGFDGQAGFEVTENLSVYVSAAYVESELQEDIQRSATTFYPTKGKEMVETPDWTFAFRGFYDTEWFSLGAQAKYTGERWATDVNDEKTDDFILVDLDARLKLDNFGWDGSYVQFNVRNVFDEEYLGNISTREAANPVDVDPGPGVIIVTPTGGALPNYAVGAPRTFMLTLRTRF